MDFDGFYNGQCFDAYTYLGAHFSQEETVFRVWAPSAHHVMLLTQGQEIPMHPVFDSGIYEASVPRLWSGTPYEYRIFHNEWDYADHCDPYGFGMDLRPDHRSIVRDLGEYCFSDDLWMYCRRDSQHSPVNIYEIHPGSFHRGGGFLRYDELAYELIPYLKDAGYNYVELMPIHEHPVDGSWGYQPTGFFAPTSRYGTAGQLKKMVDLLHRAGIGVILDFVAVHFAVDGYGLGNFDGTRLYEARDGISEWGNYAFAHGKGPVRSFLQSCANYYLREFHFDGLRLDAVSRLIYHFGDPSQGINDSGIDFLRNFNRGLKAWHPGCILIAEDTTIFPGVTAPVEAGGLGFDYKWNQGWVHDTLDFLFLPPDERYGQYQKLVFSMEYAYSEHYLLPLSHDEAQWGRGTILERLWGNYDEKFAQLRLLCGYTLLHPGKKLSFMGNEIGQFRPWECGREQDWFLRSYPKHDGFYHYVKSLNHIYLNYASLHAGDFQPECFRWLYGKDSGRCIAAFSRSWGGEQVLGFFNFSNRYYTDVYVPDFLDGNFQVFLHSDWHRFGGLTPERCDFYAPGTPMHLPPFSAVFLQRYY